MQCRAFARCPKGDEVMPAKPDRRIAPPVVVPKLRLVRSSDTTYNLRARRQVAALLALLEASGGESR